MLDLAGLELSHDEADLLSAPQVGGLILFGRNYSDCDQLSRLTKSVREVRPDLLIAVDQEGGRVQRFRQGFTRLPPMRALGTLYDREPAAARKLASDCGWLLATELLRFEIDFSFTPVLDLDYHDTTVIGDRAFHRDPEAVSVLAGSLAQGMAEAGMASVGKHFPGHGFVRGDSHTEMPVDERSLSELMQTDIRPFEALCNKALRGLMPAHVIYPDVDSCPAGFSRVWLQQIVRGQLGFAGVIFSDDLSMAAAGIAGAPSARARAALDAGCDMVLVCNDPDAAREVLKWLQAEPDSAPSRSTALASLARRCSAEEAWQRTRTERYQAVQQRLAKLGGAA